jgi:predicted RNase H-like nuclease (RuvC/YqgF family)
MESNHLVNKPDQSIIRNLSEEFFHNPSNENMQIFIENILKYKQNIENQSYQQLQLNIENLEHKVKSLEQENVEKQSNIDQLYKHLNEMNEKYWKYKQFTDETIKTMKKEYDKLKKYYEELKEYHLKIKEKKGHIDKDSYSNQSELSKSFVKRFKKIN